ncbi:MULTISPECIES: transposase [Vibrio harveyi group]|uniref:transposase n=1 Tax=Vibrio harveyi group TaxID=717610 RepID=UPI0031E8DA0F
MPKAEKPIDTAERAKNTRQEKCSTKEPWLLVTNIPNHVLNSIRVTRLYAKRMQIEESFRDLKSPAYGLALRHNRTRCTKRIDILLLMALMAEIIMWWNGLIAMQANWHYDFQAKTIKHRRVLSIPRLGKEVRCHRRYRIQESQYHWAMVEYQRLTHTCGLGEL